MGILSFLKPGRIASKWTFTAKGVIWRVLFSENGVIVGEDRDEEEKSLIYFCLDELSGKVLWREKKYEKEWWSGIEAIDGNTLFIHGYASPDMPENKGIVAVDIFSGRVLWENPGLRLLSAYKGAIVAEGYYFGKRIFCRLDSKSGIIQEESADRNKFGNMPDLGIDERRYTFPVTLISGEGEQGKIIYEHVNTEELIGSVEFIEHDDMLLFNYYEKNVKSTENRDILNNYFKIVSIANKRLIFSETLNTNVSYPVPDAFFFHDELLFYIKDRSILTAVRL